MPSIPIGGPMLGGPIGGIGIPCGGITGIPPFGIIGSMFIVLVVEEARHQEEGQPLVAVEAAAESSVRLCQSQTPCPMRQQGY